MRSVFAIVCLVLLAGCESPHGSPDHTVRIANSLEKRITAEEAKHILVDDLDFQANRARTAAGKDSSDEVKVLTALRQRHISELESLLSHFRKGDVLWTYRIYVTADKRGGEDGFALVRDGKVVEHMEIRIYD